MHSVAPSEARSLRANVKSGTAFRAPHYGVWNVCCILVQTLPCRQRVNGLGSLVTGRWLRVDGRWLRFAVRGSRFAARGSRTLNLGGRSVARVPYNVARNVCCIDVGTLPYRRCIDGASRGSRVDGRGSFPSLGRHTIVARYVCYVDVRAGGVARLPCRQRHSDHHRLRCVVPCQSTRIVRYRAKSCPCNWKTMHFVALSCERGAISCVRTRRDLLHATLRSKSCPSGQHHF